MLQKKFPQAILNKIDEAVASTNNPIAAFDADGTLWKTDLGENFFKFQIESRLLPDLPLDPWQYYQKMKNSGDPRPAYLWLAQINSGFAIETVRSWARTAVLKYNPLPLFDEQRHLVDYLLKKNVKIFVITASVKWAVEPGASQLGIPENQVLGVHTKIINSVITKDQSGVITYKEGKSQALLSETDGQKPIFGCGNTSGDYFLLKCSKVSLAVRSAQPNEELYHSEESLYQEAKKMSWDVHEFN